MTIGYRSEADRWEGPATRYTSTGDVHEMNYEGGFKCGDSVWSYHPSVSSIAVKT